jgi:hypothetical protein
MRCVGIAVLLMVCLLQSAGVEALAQEKEPAEPDTASASDIYNPPRVITPEYEAGPRPSEETRADTETEPPPAVEPRPERAGDKRCPTCPRASRARVGGGGEFSSGYLFADLSNINRRIRDMGIPALSEDIFLMGARGYTRIGHLLIGGAGYSGDTESSGIPDCCARYARVEVAYGGVMLGLAVTRPRYEVMGGMLFGGGSVEIVRERNSRMVAGWDAAWENFDEGGSDSVATDDLNMTSKITGEFIALEPFAEIKYWLLPFMALNVSASYLNAEVGRGEWKLDGVSIPDSPESKIGGWSLRLGLHFGV